jgi:hypothetical protein
MSREGTPTGDTQTDGVVGSEVPDATVTPPPAVQTPEPAEDDMRYDEQPHYGDDYGK